MDYVTPIITPIVKSLLVPVNRHLGFLVSSSSYVRNMHVRIIELDSISHDVHATQFLNQVNRLLVPHHISKWLEEVETIKETADRIPPGGVGRCNLKMRYKRGKQASDILKEIDRLMQERGNMEWNDKRIPLAMVTSPRPSAAANDENYNQNKNKIPSRDLIFNDALKCLEPNNNKTQKMALCGMPGVGKTTMMEQLKKVAAERKMFDCIVKVVVGQNPNLIHVQQAVIDYTGGDLIEKTKDTRAECLKERFKVLSEEGKKKILVILDDVWDDFNLEDIGLTSPLPVGFKLLITSREESVCTKMGVEVGSIIKVVVLEETEAKSLFWETVGVAHGCDIEPELQHIGEDIVKRCGGLPIAITTIASTLRDISEKDEWKNALYRIQNKDYKALINIFEFSYKNLKEDDLKAIFLLSGLFPEDYNIVIEDLVMYGWGLKFFKNVHNIAIARSRVNTCVNKLRRSNLLIESDREGCVKMHDLVRDFALSNFSEVKQASIVNYDITSEELKEDESYQRILLKCMGMFEFPTDFKYPNLTLLKLMDGGKQLKFAKDFYTRMEKLEVVAYDNMYLHLLPQYSTKLRTLSLRSCSLMDDISFLGDLINLEVLRLVNCGIHKLPFKIGNLKRLKLLDLTGCECLCIDDGVFKNLDKLEELYMRNLIRRSIRFTDANCEELYMLSRNLSALEVEFFGNKAQPKYVSFEKLDRFRISVGSSLKGVDDLYSFKNTLCLDTSCEDILECRINELFRKTEILYLEVKGMKHLQDISMHPHQHSFCNLKALHVTSCSNLTCLFTIHVAKGLRKLESLKIWYCHYLEDIWSSEITSSEEEVNFISTLRKIEVIRCDNIVNLFPCNPMRLLTHLEQITVENCPSIEVLFNIDLGKTEQHSSNSRLKMVKVDYLKNLREVWRIKDAEDNYSCPLVHGFQAIESLDIKNCARFRNIVTPTSTKFDMTAFKEINISNIDKLVRLEIHRMLKEEIPKAGDNMPVVPLPSSLTRNLHSVRKIDFCSFPRVEVVFDIQSPSKRDESVITQQQLLLLPSLEHLNLEEMHMLTHVWKCNNWNDLFILHKHQLRSSFQNLTTITIVFCTRVKYLFSPLMMKLLSNLKEVKIKFCHGMEEVVSNRDDDKEEEIIEFSSTDTTTTLVPRLEILHLNFLGNLKHIGGGVAKGTTNVSQYEFSGGHVSWSLCQYSTEIYIEYCYALSSVIPYYAAGRTQKLQVLKVSENRSMVELFETTKNNINNISGCSSSTVATPMPRKILVHKFPNLRELYISDCGCLENICTFSTLESLSKLEKLTVKGCKSMKVIVKEEYGEQTMNSSKDVIFSHLKSIKLDSLPNLAGFFLGTNIDFHWPLLDDVIIRYCPQMLVFTYGRSTAPRLKYIQTELGKHNSELVSKLCTPSTILHPSISEGRPWSFHSLVECNLEQKNLPKVFPSNALQQLQKLEKIHAVWCKYVEEIFEVTKNESKTVVKFPKLREVDLYGLANLRYIWKSNEWGILEFPNLTRLSIVQCESLEHVFTCSMVGCVMQLQELHIKYCVSMKVIVKEDEDCDAQVSEIKFPQLKSLRLEGLPSLQGFCLGKEDFKFPSLDTLVIKDRIMVFTKGRSIAPKLTTVETSFGSFNGGEDISSYIMTEKEETPSTSLDSVSSHPTISKPRPLPLHNLIKCNLSSYDKHTKIFASKELQQLQKLETIHAHMCDVEEVFEVPLEVTNNESQTVFKFPKLREVHLERMHGLKYIWKSNQFRILEFPNLLRLTITRCQSLKHVFTCSMVGCVMQLQELHIDTCRYMTEIVKGEEEEEHCDAKLSEIKFPQLKCLRLNSLWRLEGFCLGKEDFTFPSLDTMEITECSQITVFTQGRTIAPKLTIVEIGRRSYVVGEDINSFIETKKELGR